MAKLKEYFPLPEYREHQEETITKILAAYKKGKKYVILEAPTGAGKSAIGMTIARIMQNSYYLTVQKILQSQLKSDFEKIGAVDLQGRNAYPCWLMKDKLKVTIPTRADRGICYRKGKSNLDGCRGKCYYYNQLQKAMDAPITILNFSSFLYQKYHAINRFVEPRNLMIIDEAHNIEQQMMNFVEVNLKKKDFKINWPDTENITDYIKEFEDKDVYEEVNTIVTEQKAILKIAEENSAPEKEITTICDELEKWESILKQLYILSLFNKIECVIEYDNEKVSFKPLKANYLTKMYLLNDNVAKLYLMMSATILSPTVFTKNIGLKMEEVEYITMPSTFPKENRPIILDYAGSMSYKNKTKDFPKIIKKINTIMNQYKGKRGIIHCQSFSNMKAIIEGVNCSNRLTHQNDYPKKEDLLTAHRNNPESVLIGPALHEGIDLPRQDCEFAAIVKIPYASFVDDKQLALRMKADPSWYLWITALKFIQSLGRGVRSKTDKCDIYVVDSDFDNFFNRCDREGMFPDWVVEAIKT